MRGVAAPAGPAGATEAATPSRPAWAGADWGLLATVTALGAALRLWRLGYPHRYVFDETYYARDACLYLGHTMAFCRAPGPTEQSYVHPELGKWLIAAGEWLAGYRTVGWRLPSALFGTALVAVVFLLGRRLFGRWGGGIAGFLAATDFVLITQSRLAMLDIFLAFFVALGFLFVTYEHERVLAPRAAPSAPAPLWPGGREIGWRLAIGLAFGAACSVKWSGAYALAGGGVLVLAWNVGAALRRRSPAGAGPGGGGGSGGRGPVGEALVTLVAVGVPAVGVYLLTYGQWFAQHHFSFGGFLSLQHRMLDYQLHLTTPNPYQTRAWTWPFLIRPIAYWHIAGNETAHQVLLFPNPAVWWAALPAGAWFLLRALRRRHSAERIVMTGWLAQYLPWLAVSRPLFFFYMTPVTPFMDLALAGGLLALAGHSAFRRRLVVVYLAGVAVLVAYYYPGLVGALHPRL
jgi:dolichyl-phosphate-mannose-protein mannosyltransferase